MLTDEVLADEDVRRYLSTVPHRSIAFRATLRGFEGEVILHRIDL